ncbi:MAG: hypothetical protein ABJF10_00150 [Chthoniobacter sp.]|uniref:hypothetical protein n=1 Tax=Chthoniobacter sp. TaxID=2510640 RepID=UPI0032A7B109
MNTTDLESARLGKIARLPREIRRQLNERLADNEPQPRLVRWLNALPEVQQVLADLFEGRPISQQNLSAWKGGGYREWARREENQAWARDFLVEATDLQEEIAETEDRSSLLDRVGDRMALALLQLFREAEDGEKGPSRIRQMLEITRELARLRRGDHQRLRTQIVQERWHEEQERRQEEQEAARTERYVAELEHKKRQVVATLPRITAYLGEYLHGLAKGTLTPERAEWIRDYFADNEADFRDLGLDGMLPTGKKLERAVEKLQERFRREQRAAQGEEAGRGARNSAAEGRETPLPTSPHKAAPADTR